jgi:branched-chain amino acid transport system substrate-binding protein
MRENPSPYGGKTMKVKAIGAVLLALLLAGAATAADVIKVGGIFDMSGATSDVGKDYAIGVADAVDFINGQGGINGKKIDLISNDYAYAIPEAINLYKRYRDQEKVVCIQGWGTGDTEALSKNVNEDKIPYMSASYSSHLTDASKTPYNFFVGTSYSDGMRIALKYLRENFKESRKPKVVFIYPDHPYGKAPIPAGKEMAGKLGFDIGPDEIVALNATEAVSQLLHMKQFAPDFAWIGGTTSSAAVILKDARKLGLKTQFFVNVWGMDESSPKRAGEAAEGAIMVAPFAFWGENVPGMKAAMDTHQKKHPNDTHTVRYIQGWTSALVMAEAMKRAKTLDGPGFKAAMETLKDFDTGGLTAPLTFTATDHRPNTSMRLYTVKGGKVEKLSDFISIGRDPEFLGR